MTSLPKSLTKTKNSGNHSYREYSDDTHTHTNKLESVSINSSSIDFQQIENYGKSPRVRISRAVESCLTLAANYF